MNKRSLRPLTLTVSLSLLTGLAAGIPALAQDAPKPDAPKDAPKPETIKAQPPAPAVPAKPAEIDPEAKKAVEAMVDAYHALKSYSGRLAFIAKQGTQPPQALTGQIAFALPGSIKVTGTQTGSGLSQTLTSDGKNVFQVVSNEPLTYKKITATPGPINIVKGLQITGNGGSGLTGIMLTTPPEEAKKRIMEVGMVSKMSLLPEATADGVAVRQVKIEMGEPRPMVITFVIGKDDNLLRKLTLEGGDEKSPFQISEEYSEVKANPELAPTYFAFTPPPGAKEKTPPAPPAEKLRYDARIKPGAAPLPLAGKDLTGKPLNLAEYKGKVVLVDFWATWCGPCRAELPNVIAVYNKYKAKGFDVLGVSLDEDDAAKVVAFAKNNKMTWRHIYDGKGWETAAAAAYGIQAIPFTVLIGKDGKIAAVGARGEDLEPAVKAALAKK